MPYDLMQEAVAQLARIANALEDASGSPRSMAGPGPNEPPPEPPDPPPTDPGPIGDG